MAGGRKIYEARIAQLDDMGVEEVFRLYLEHGTVKALVSSLWEPAHEGQQVGVSALYGWLDRNPAAKDAWRRLRKMRGDMDADEAVHIAMNATQEDWQAKKLQVETLKWRAGVNNREDYGTGVDAVVSTLGQAILRAITAAEQQERLPVPATDAEYEIEE